MRLGRLSALLGGRSGRSEFWLSLAGLIGLNLVLTFTLGDPVLVSLISLPLWIVIAARRLHDFGRSGWWGLIPFMVGFLLGFVGGLGVSISSFAETVVNAVTMLAAAVVLGIVPGTAGVNRFGDRRGTQQPT